MGLRLLQYSDIEHAYDDPDRIGRLAGLIDSRRDDDALVVGTGDNIGPSVRSVAADGRQALELFDRIRPDVSTFGNHDLDYGLDQMLDVIRESPQIWVCANVRVEGRSIAEEASVVPSVVGAVDGHRIGFFGLLDPETATTAPVPETITVDPPVEAARQATDALRSRGATHVVALGHLQDVEEVAESTGVDVVLAGHVHTDRLDRIAGTLVTRPGVGGEFLIEVTLSDGEWTGERLTVADASVRPDVRDAFDRSLPAEYGREVVTLTEPLARSEQTDDARTHVGTVIANAYRRETGADVGLQHGGGIRSGPPLTGAVSVADLVGTIPYQDPVAVVELTGDALGDVLAQFVDTPDGYLSGVAVARAEDGTAVPLVDGSEVVDDAAYTLATTEYLLRSMGLGSLLDDGQSAASTGRTQYDVLVEHVRRHGVETA